MGEHGGRGARRDRGKVWLTLVGLSLLDSGLSVVAARRLVAAAIALSACDK